MSGVCRPGCLRADSRQCRGRGDLVKMLAMEPWALSMLGWRSATELHPLSFNIHPPKEQKDAVDHSFKEQIRSSDFSSTSFISPRIPPHSPRDNTTTVWPDRQPGPRPPAGTWALAVTNLRLARHRNAVAPSRQAAAPAAFFVSPPQTHQADEAEASVAVDEDLAGLAITLKEPLEVLLRDVGGQVPHEEAAALRVSLLARLEETLDVDGEAHLLVWVLLRSRGWRRLLPGQRQRHGRRGHRFALAGRRLQGAKASGVLLNAYLLQVSS